MKVKEVIGIHRIQTFHRVPHYIYRNDSEWVPHLQQEVEAVFDPKKNPLHKHGAFARWIVEDDAGRPIGRIAAFVDHRKASLNGPPTGGCGFFECIDNAMASRMLFAEAKRWLQSQGMQVMLGPVNFGENDSYWGLLVEGYSRPCHGMNYNPPYYTQLFCDYGFSVAYEQITNKLEVSAPLPPRFQQIAARAMERGGVQLKHLEIKRPDLYARALRDIYNDAWSDFPEFSPLDWDTVIHRFRAMRPILDEKMVLFAYVNGVPAAFLVVIPDANEWMDGVNGNLDFRGKLVFLWNRFRKKPTRMRAVVMGTRPAYRNRGIESALFIRLRDHVASLGHYRELELSWVGDFNERMLSIHQATGARPCRKHATFRLTFASDSTG